MYALGLKIVNSSLSCALVKKEGKSFEILFLKQLPLCEDVKPLYTLLEGWEGTPPIIATSIDANETLFRKIHLPIKEQSKALKAIPFQLESILPVNPDEMLITPLLKKTTPKTWEALLFCTKESSLKKLLDAFEKHAIDPLRVTLDPMCLYRVAKFLYPNIQEGMFFQLGRGEGQILCLSQGEIALSHTISFDQTDPLAIRNYLKRLKAFLELKNLLTEKVPSLLLGTSADWEEAWKEILSEEILPVQETVSLNAIALGSALNALIEDDHTTELREGKWVSAQKFEKRKHALFYYAVASCAAALMIFASSSLFFKMKYASLEKSLLSHLPAEMQKASLSSPTEIEHTLFEWEKSMNGQKLPFPFFSTVPSAADVLAWLSTHPSLTTKEGLPKEGIAIQAVRYHLYKYPKFGSSKDPYSARVELEFIAQTPRLAREFHDALLTGDKIVNAKKDISWNVQQTTYFTSFELLPLNSGGKS